MPLDVVVTDYRTPEDLDEFLASLYEHKPDCLGFVTVVLVSPTVQDERVAAQWEPFIGFHTLRFDDNVGYARACNRAAKDGDGDVLAFFNADVILVEGALDACYNKLLERPDWAILGPRQIDTIGRITAGGVFGAPQSPRQRSWLKRDVGQCSDVRDDVLTVSGAAFFIKRAVWDELTECQVYQEVTGGAEGAMLPTPHY